MRTPAHYFPSQSESLVLDVNDSLFVASTNETNAAGTISKGSVNFHELGEDVLAVVDVG